MEVLLNILGVFVIACVVIGIFAGVRHLIQRKQFLKIAKVHALRNPISDAQFCEKLSLQADQAPLVSAIRKNLAKPGSHNPDRIYPEDELGITFGLERDDDMDCFAMDFISIDYGELPYEEINSVGDFVKYLVLKRYVTKHR
jgi:hypothetical protein